MIKDIRNWFFSGLLLLLPVVVTIFVIYTLVVRIGEPSSAIFDKYIDHELATNPVVSFFINFLSFLLVCVAIAILGWFSQLLLGRVIVNAFDTIINRMPVVRSLYNTVKQIRDTFVQQQKAVFQKVVLIEYPRPGVWVLGFLTGTGKGEVQYATSSELLNIFVPTTPNPTSGFLLMVPREQVKELEMSVTDGMKLIISGGAVTPAYPPPTKALPVETEPNPVPTLERSVN